MKVIVTKEHIDNGVCGSSTNCPIAYALIEKSSVKLRSVGSGFVEVVNKKNETFLYILPQKARQFIEDFDDGKEVEPFSFEMRLEK